MKTIHIVVLLFAFAIVSSVSGQVSYLANDNGAPPGSYLGWDWAQDLEFRTNNTTYMQLMQNGTSSINGSVLNTSGFLGLHTTKPYSMFHIQGPNNSPWGGDGFRVWMHTGMYIMENSDNLYVGLKDESYNRSDAIWSWGDDNTIPTKNYSRFIFAGSAPAAGDGEDVVDPDNINGREIMRLDPTGIVGIGPRFEANGIRSNIHNHMENDLPVWFQQSNDAVGHTENDGLRMGIEIPSHLSRAASARQNWVFHSPSMAATPGNTFPSRNSSMAPPPVLT